MKSLEQMVEIQDEIIDIFRKHQVPYVEAEAMLLFLAGVSAGVHQRPIANKGWVAPAWVGWQAGANHEPVP